MDECCATCRFFLAKEPIPGEDYCVGDCRRYPPTWAVNDELSEPKFPYMDGAEWCGEYQASLTSSPEEVG